MLGLAKHANIFRAAELDALADACHLVLLALTWVRCRQPLDACTLPGSSLQSAQHDSTCEGAPPRQLLRASDTGRPQP